MRSIIVVLIPLAIKGVKYRPLGAGPLLRRNLLDLRAGRHHRAVSRNQAHRHDLVGRRLGLKESRIMSAHCIRPAVSLLVLMTVLLGVVYPLVITGVARVAFPAQAAGSLIHRDGKLDRIDA